MNAFDRINKIIDFLKSKKFAGGVRPTVYVECLDMDGTPIDVITIKNTANTPYYLHEDSGGLHKGNIYTRIVDTNTPKNSNADIDKVEWLWKKRFGIDKSGLEKFELLSSNYNDWVYNNALNNVFYNKYSMEYYYSLFHLNDEIKIISCYFSNVEMLRFRIKHDLKNSMFNLSSEIVDKNQKQIASNFCVIINTNYTKLDRHIYFSEFKEK